MQCRLVIMSIKMQNYLLGTEKHIDLRNWQLEKMRIGLQQAKDDVVANNKDLSRVFEKYKAFLLLNQNLKK